MIGEVAAVLSALKALNDGLSTIKEAAGHGHTLQSLVGRWATANEKYRDVERNKAGAMSYKEALAMESAKRQLENFDKKFKDICLLQGQGDLYWSVKNRMEESRISHEKEVARLKKRRKEVRKNLKLAGTVFFGWLSFMCLVFLFVWAWEYNSGL
tara:strand:+ start:36 stop:500 length:465 start_codon:yes stop_codon:yes gene_type:complete